MTMSKKYKKISPKLKSRILSESFLPGCIISNLAKSYGISAKAIYNWRRSSREVQVKDGELGSEVEASRVFAASPASAYCAAAAATAPVAPASCSLESKWGATFVELPIPDSEVYALQKASLIFEDFALTLEGRIKSSSLCAIVKILEEASC